ncbi:hypothetical protein ACUR5C_02925 [Aliikangiella sp. IMCC44653]
MLRFLIKILLLAIVVIAATMLISDWKLNKDIKAFANTISPFAQLEYDSASVGLNGEIKLNAVSVYVFSMGASIEIGELRFFAGNLFELAFLNSTISQQELPDNAYLTIRDVLIPFDNNMSKALTQPSSVTSLDLIESAFCGEQETIGLNQLERMGYNYFALSAKQFYMLDRYSGSVVLNGEVDIEELGRFDYQMNIGGVLAWLESIQATPFASAATETVLPNLTLFELTAKDNGYNQRKAEFCAIQQGVEVAEYYTGHVSAVAEMLDSVGVEMSLEAQKFYTDYIKPESELHLFMQPKVGFELNGSEYYDLGELIDLTRMRLSINQQDVTALLSEWDLSRFDEIGAQFEKAKLLADPERSQYRTVLIKKAFVDIPPVYLDRHMHERVKIYRDDGQDFDGRLSRANARSVWLKIRTEGGELELPVARNQIVKVQVYQEVSAEG